MKKKILKIALAFIAFGNIANAQEESIFPIGDKGPNVHHVGDVWLKELHTADSIFNMNIAVATMAKGARLDWHKHPGGQILMVTAGEGYYQERGQNKKIMHKGDVFKCSPDVEHWHGATPESGVTYMASSPMHKGKTVWLEKLTDKEYYETEIRKITLPNHEAIVMQLSLDKWRWMSEQKVDTLAMLFNDKAIFVHMGATMNKTQELDVIKTGKIQYKQADIQESSVQFIGSTAIVLHKLKLTAVVGGNEVVNPFSVTEVYIQLGEKWSLGSLSFTKLLVPN